MHEKKHQLQNQACSRAIGIDVGDTPPIQPEDNGRVLKDNISCGEGLQTFHNLGKEGRLCCAHLTPSRKCEMGEGNTMDTHHSAFSGCCQQFALHMSNACQVEVGGCFEFAGVRSDPGAIDRGTARAPHDLRRRSDQKVFQISCSLRRRSPSSACGKGWRDKGPEHVPFGFQGRRWSGLKHGCAQVCFNNLLGRSTFRRLKSDTQHWQLFFSGSHD